jgi:hypothetical protein
MTPSPVTGPIGCDDVVGECPVHDEVWDLDDHEDCASCLRLSESED